jgi:hypothetical protein
LRLDDPAGGLAKKPEITDYDYDYEYASKSLSLGWIIV